MQHRAVPNSLHGGGGSFHCVLPVPAAAARDLPTLRRRPEHLQFRAKMCSNPRFVASARWRLSITLHRISVPRQQKRGATSSWERPRILNFPMPMSMLA